MKYLLCLHQHLVWLVFLILVIVVSKYIISSQDAFLIRITCFYLAQLTVTTSSINLSNHFVSSRYVFLTLIF